MTRTDGVARGDGVAPPPQTILDILIKSTIIL